ncbi:restriction endonuclease subunit S [Pseudoflavitalea sp. G-6-1-2]|uniref:restriction endonuclease subunit S n=1 Tax=Pseudoflavitalea sp. G-6-1-2 TaxID=2728841 RepID=UPI0019814AD6|nr:restriction endonuclease subunit S [Pseudoflavitalea sp. G-6-1-2]
MRASYPTYKSTSIPWLPEMPEHWDALKAKHIFKERSEKGYPNEPLLAATQTKGVVRKEEYETRTVTAQKDFHLLKLVKEEDFVISLRSFQGGIEYAYHRGIISPAYTIFYEKNKVPVNKAFYRHLFKSHPFINSLTLFVTGIREGQNIDYAEFKDSLLPFPPLPEQTAIANYLDAKTEQINRFIEKKEKLIKSLREKIDVIVQSIEGEQLNDSKFWPTIPKTWKVEKAKRIFIERNIKNKSSEALLASTQDRGVLPKDMCSENFVSPAGDLSGLKLVCENDFVISLRSFQGGIEYSPYRGIISPAYTIFNLREQYESPWMTQYYKYLFKTPQFISLLNTAITGIRDGKNVNWVDFAELPIPIPTEDDVKMMMEDFIRFEELVKVFEVEKQKLNEFKNSLIAEVVTGKIKVA